MSFTAKAAKSAKDENELSRSILELTLDVGYRLDLLVADLVIVEVKCVDALLAIHQAQLLSYLKLSEKRLGLLLNFNVVRLKDGIKRLVNGL